MTFKLNSCARQNLAAVKRFFEGIRLLGDLALFLGLFPVILDHEVVAECIGQNEGFAVLCGMFVLF